MEEGLASGLKKYGIPEHEMGVRSISRGLECFGPHESQEMGLRWDARLGGDITRPRRQKGAPFEAEGMGAPLSPMSHHFVPHAPARPRRTTFRVRTEQRHRATRRKDKLGEAYKLEGWDANRAQISCGCVQGEGGQLSWGAVRRQIRVNFSLHLADSTSGRRWAAWRKSANGL